MGVHTEARGTNRTSIFNVDGEFVRTTPDILTLTEAEYAPSAPSFTQLYVPEGFPIWACVHPPSTEVSEAAEEGWR